MRSDSVVIGGEYIDNRGFVVKVKRIERSIFEDKVVTDKYIYNMEYFLKQFHLIKKEQK